MLLLVNKDLTDTFMPRLDCCVKRDKPFQFYGRCIREKGFTLAAHS